jgi:hypothetical protein
MFIKKRTNNMRNEIMCFIKDLYMFRKSSPLEKLKKKYKILNFRKYNKRDHVQELLIN